jgi:hypothetical protein
MAHDTAQLESRIREEIEALRRALDDRRAGPRRLSASIVAAYRSQLDRHYAELEEIGAAERPDRYGGT